MAVTNPNYHIDQNSNYSTITLLPGLNEAQWSDIEQAGSDITSRLSSMRSPAVIVDLTPLNYMGSSMVAMIVRCWKNVQSNKGRIVVVCNNDVVREVISLAGLTKVWPIVQTRDEALSELGVSSLGGGGDRWLIVAGVIALLAGIVGVGLLLTNTGDSQVALGVLFAGAGAAFVLGLITLVRSASSGRYWGLGIVIASVAVGVIGFLNMNRAGLAIGPAPVERAAPEPPPETETQPEAPAPASNPAEDT